MSRDPRLRILLAILFAVSVLFQSVSTYGVFDKLLHGSERPAMPLEFGMRGPAVTYASSEAVRAGIRLDDVLTEVGGRPFTGRAVLQDAIRRKHPGDPLSLTVRKGGGETVSVSVPLGAEEKRPLDSSDWLQRIAINICLPWLCLALGFWVAAVRPFDPLAWILLGLMLSFSQHGTDSYWPFPGAVFPYVWQQTLMRSWGLWMLLFGLRFAGPMPWDERRPWLKWLLIGPLLTSQAVMLFHDIAKQTNFALMGPPRPYVFAYLAGIYLSMAAIGLFFMSLGMKSGMAKNPDAHRRLTILWAGSSVSLTPLFLAVVYSIIRDRDVFVGVPGWYTLLCLLALPVFPLTLTYVIVVQRAMEVRGVVRQSVQYALARRGLWVLRLVVGLLAVLAIYRVETNPHARTVDWVRAGGTAIALFLLRARFFSRISAWVDRRFFREAYSAEQVLSELGEQARKFVETGPLLETVTNRIAGTLHATSAAVFLKDHQAYRLSQTVGENGQPQESLETESLVIQHLRAASRPALIYFDDPQSWVHEAPTAEQKQLRRMNAQLLLPLCGREQLMGVMALGPKRSEEPYSRTDLQLLESVAAQTGMALENSQLMAAVAAEAAQRERLNRELEIAREVQERLFPQNYPPVPGMDYAGRCRPAHAVGGDYYDFVAVPGGRFGVAIGDISGKGISAALLMASLQASLRGQAMAGIRDLASLMRNVNQLVYEASTSNRYATFFYGEYDPATRQLDYVNAGHNAPMVLRGAEVLRLEACGPVVGLLKGIGYERAATTLQPGDIFIGYTDGISEAMTVDDEEWGEDRLIETARKYQDLPAAEMISRIVAATDAFTGPAKQYDDMTLIIVKVA